MLKFGRTKTYDHPNRQYINGIQREYKTGAVKPLEVDTADWPFVLNIHKNS
jgi:hypothetical protein